MLVVFGILVILASVVLGLIVLVQNPKGGGLSGSLGGFGNQLMGVKQTTDVLEKGTWVFAGIVGILCVTSALFINSANTGASKNEDLINNAPATAPKSTPATTAPMPTAPAPTAPTAP